MGEGEFRFEGTGIAATDSVAAKKSQGKSQRASSPTNEEMDLKKIHSRVCGAITETTPLMA